MRLPPPLSASSLKKAIRSMTCALRVEALRPQPGVVEPRGGPRPLGQLGVVLRRHAEQLADHLDRKRHGDVLDEVELTLLERPIDQVAGYLAHVRLEVGDAAWP